MTVLLPEEDIRVWFNILSLDSLPVTKLIVDPVREGNLGMGLEVMYCT